MFVNECNWMGCGVVVRDHEGLVCAALSKTIDGCPDPTTAEAMGALCAIVEVANSFRSWTVEHVSREGNYAAHSLEKLAVQGVKEDIWMEEVPCIIQDVVTLELQALSV
jgi:hypothetical protein